MKKIKRPIIFYPIIFSIFPILSLYIRNMSLVLLFEIIIEILLVLIFMAILWRVLFRITKNKHKSALMVSVFFIFFFSFGQILPAAVTLLLKVGIDIRSQVFNQIGWKLWVFSIVWTGIFLLFLFLIYKVKSDLRTISTFMNMASIGLLSFSLILSAQFFHGQEQKSQDMTFPPKISSFRTDKEPKQQIASTRIEKPDIYYIILDGYARNDILESHYNLDNQDLITYLSNEDFYIATESLTNYAHTIHSLSSSLNLHYLNEIAEKIGKSSTGHQPLIKLLQTSRLIEFLTEQGYTIVAFESGYQPTELLSANHYLSPGRTLTAFQNELINLTPLTVWLRDLQYDIQRKRILFTFDQIPNSVQNNQPSFVFAHVTAPHPPFVFGPNGEKESPDMSYSNLDANKFTHIAGQDEYVRRYRNQVIYLNKLLQETIDEILAKPEGNSIIIVQSDHGPGSRLDWDNFENTSLEERMSILNIYYFPDQNYSWLYPEITPVNSFRIVLDQYFGTQLGIIEDKSYFSLMDTPYDFIDVTNEISHH